LFSVGLLLDAETVCGTTRTPCKGETQLVAEELCGGFLSFEDEVHHPPTPSAYHVEDSAVVLLFGQ
jgi:hypothetical protein